MKLRPFSGSESICFVSIDLAELGALGFDLNRIRLDADRFFDGADPKSDVDAQLIVHFQIDSGGDELIKSRRSAP